MKILIAGLLSLSLILALSACTDSVGGRSNEQTQAPPPSATTTTVSSETTLSSTITTTASTSVQITRDRAIELALQAAGLTRDAVHDLEAELDRERGELFWEVDFETREHEYSYDIHAQTGAIAKGERERED